MDGMRFGHPDVVIGSGSQLVLPSAPTISFAFVPSPLVSDGWMASSRPSVAGEGKATGAQLMTRRGGDMQVGREHAEIKRAGAPDTFIPAFKSSAKGRGGHRAGTPHGGGLPSYGSALQQHNNTAPPTAPEEDFAAVDRAPSGQRRGSRPGAVGGVEPVVVSEVPRVEAGVRRRAEAESAQWEEGRGVSEVGPGRRLHGPNYRASTEQGHSSRGGAKKDEEKPWNDWCRVCKSGGLLMCCDGIGCSYSFHPDCLYPPLSEVDSHPPSPAFPATDCPFPFLSFSFALTSPRLKLSPPPSLCPSYP